MIRPFVMELLRDMNQLYRAGWSTTLIQHKMGKKSEWFKDTLRQAEYDLYCKMKRHYDYWRKRTPLNKRPPCFFDTEHESMH